MKALLWKDYHVSRPILVFGTVLMLVPYLIVGIAEFVSWRRYGGAVDWPHALVGCAIASLGLSVLTIAAIAGNAFAGERVDRSAEFLGALPVSHARIVASKLCVALAAVVALWLVNIAASYGLAPWLACVSQPEMMGNLPQMRANAFPTLAVISVLTFGAGWLASALLSSAAISVGLALAAPAVLAVGLALIAELFGLRWEGAVDAAYGIICVVLGLAALGAGSIYYVSRVEP